MDAQNIAVVVIENPLLDITVQDPENAIHTKYELKHGAASLADEKTMPIHDELYAREDRELTCGGAALNSARCCNHVLAKASHPTGKVAFVGCVAKDPSGEVLEKKLQEVDMLGCWAYTSEEATGRCAVVVHGKERTLCANIGAAAKYPVDHYEAQKSVFTAAKMVYSTGFFITSCYDVLQKVMQQANDENKPMLFNIAAVFLVDFFKDQTMFCIEHADYVFCNEDEAAAYAKAVGISGDNERLEAAKHIAKSKKANQARPRFAIVTQGSDQVIIAEHDPATADAEVKVTYVDVPKIESDLIIDTNGAGDAFAGGFLAALSTDCSVEESVKAGIKMSGIVVQRLGCQFE